MGEVQLSTDSFPHRDNGRLLAQMSLQSSAPQSAMRWGSFTRQISLCRPGEGLRFRISNNIPREAELLVPESKRWTEGGHGQALWLLCGAEP